MTATGDFIPSDEDFLDEPLNPVIFGIELSPAVIGGLIALVGIGAAVYGYIKLVQPVVQANTALSAEIATKEGQLVSQAQQLQDIAKVEAELDTAMARRRDVYSLFANEKTMDTLLIDINQRIEGSNATLSGVRNQVKARGIPPILVEAKLEAFTPGEKVVVSDGSLGDGVNGKLKRETYSIQFSGDYAQTQVILRNLERLEPLLMIRDFNLTSGSPVAETVIGSGGTVVVEPKIPLTTSFQIDALMPTADVDVPPPVAEAPPAAAPPAEAPPPAPGG
ncbi:MAG: hypothetical protein HC800_01180 [Phormidesmis sp. RL_2_1]|nr:hypothetical protein [Phormidesmis sp. RL_2_1]